MFIHQILKDLQNLQIITITTVITLLAVTPVVQGLLQVNQIHEDVGYTTVKIKEVEIVNETNTILHVIDVEEIDELLRQIETNILKFDMINKELLNTVVADVRSKIKSMKQRETRKKRGLLNVIGDAHKWLFGTMNDDDRQEILEHLKIDEENNHNSILNSNKQVSINTHFNDTFNILRKAVEQDRNKTVGLFNSISQQGKAIEEHSMYLDHMLKLRYLESKVDQILDSIAAAKNNVFHPSILTREEQSAYDIDFLKIKLVRVGILKYINQSLVIAIKIPKNYLTEDLKLVVPLPNTEFLEIEENVEKFVIKKINF